WRQWRQFDRRLGRNLQCLQHHQRRLRQLGRHNGRVADDRAFFSDSNERQRSSQPDGSLIETCTRDRAGRPVPVLRLREKDRPMLRITMYRTCLALLAAASFTCAAQEPASAAMDRLLTRTVPDDQLARHRGGADTRVLNLMDIEAALRNNSA